MYRLLIVDDEPDITEGLYTVFENIGHLELEVYKAYSGFEAINVLNSIKIDIVLTDICMPGLNGLQLMEKIRRNWPQCRIIFLTGYDEFEYVYTAIKYEGVNYLLKTEGFEAIVEAVEKAVKQIEDSVKINELVDKAKEYMNKLIPLVQREYLADLLDGYKSTLETRKQRFCELEIPLNYCKPVLLLVGRINGMPNNINSLEKTKMLYSIKLLAEQYISPVLTCTYVICKRSVLVWIIQPASFLNSSECGQIETLPWKQVISMVKSSVETIQIICKESLNMQISFAIDNKETSWEKISTRCHFLKMLLYSQFGQGMDILLVKNDHENINPNQYMQYRFNKVEHLETYMESGQKDEFFKLMTELEVCLKEIKCKQYNPALDIFYSISLMFLAYVNRWNLAEKIASKIGLNKLTQIDEHASWTDTFKYFRQLADIIFQFQKNEEQEGPILAVNRVKQYINSHPAEDLSISKLAEIVYFNPSYLSRIFKKVTGVNLLNYINDVRINKAKELLMDCGLKINQIAVSVGYNSASYFTQFFKRITGLSPQEYRDKYLNR